MNKPVAPVAPVAPIFAVRTATSVAVKSAIRAGARKQEEADKRG